MSQAKNTWKLDYSAKARKQLQKIDPAQRTIILAWMNKNVDGCSNPRNHGKGLVSDRSGEWRYRIGNFRVLCDIQSDRLVVLALKVAHRSQVYRR